MPFSKNKKISQWITLVERPVKLEDNTSYQLVTVRRGFAGVESRGIFKGKEIKVKNYFLVQAGDFLISKRQIAHGACGIVPESLDGAVVSNEYNVFVPQKETNIEFFFLIMQLPYYKRLFYLMSDGVHIEKLLFKTNDWMKRSLSLPPLPEQQKIATILSTQDKVIELKEKLLVQKQQQKKYLMQQLLMPKNKEKSFKSIHLSDISRLIKKHVDGQKFNYVSTENISPNLSGKALFDESNIEISGVGFNAGDILVGNIRPYLKKVWRANKDGLCSTDVLVFRPIGISSEFLYYLIANDNFFFYVMTTAKGSKMPRGDKKAIMNAKILIPESKIEQNFLVELLSTADHEIDLLQKSIEAEKQKKKALMQLLLTGKVSVRI